MSVAPNRRTSKSASSAKKGSKISEIRKVKMMVAQTAIYEMLGSPFGECICCFGVEGMGRSISETHFSHIMTDVRICISRKAADFLLENTGFSRGGTVFLDCISEEAVAGGYLSSDDVSKIESLIKALGSM